MWVNMHSTIVAMEISFAFFRVFMRRKIRIFYDSKEIYFWEFRKETHEMFPWHDNH